MDESQEHNNEPRSTKKLLSNLPKIQASPDFEERLYQRISQETRSQISTGWLKNTFLPQRMPVFAYSLTALVLVGVVSYYSFFRSGIVPKSDQLMLQERENNVQSYGSNTEAIPDDKRTDIHLNNTKPSEQKTEVQMETKAYSNEKSDLKQMQIRKKDIDADEKIKGQEETNDGLLRNERIIGRSDAQTENEQGSSQSITRNRGQQVPLPQSSSAPGKIQMMLDERNTAVKAPVLQKEVQGIIRPSAKSTLSNEVDFQTQLKSITDQIDTLAPKDSTKIDSLRNVQKQLQMQQQKAKSKRPNN